MAKERKLKRPKSDDSDLGASTRTSSAPALDPGLIALGLLAGALVYVFYHPSDSVEVERGGALWFGLMSIALVTLTLGWFSLRPMRTCRQSSGPPPAPGDADGEQGDAVEASTGDGESRERRWGTWPRVGSWLLDGLPWLLAAWMMLAAWATSPPGNLRMATNEAWFWITAAAVFTASRRLLRTTTGRRAVLVLITASACGLAAHGLHQQWVSLPQLRDEYRSDPDKMLREAGWDAPSGSTERMVFENRLFDGGPTATFALANSLAAVLMIGAIISLAALRLRWIASSAAARITWAGLCFLCVAGLLATRSRAATFALFLGIVLIVVWGHARDRTPRRLMLQLVGLVVAGGLMAGGLVLFGNPEWYEAASASLAVRLQYWRSTAALVWDRPLFAAGPGNFQSIYDRYREPSATEQIAEPHNFLMETWAAGGWVSLAILVTLIAVAVAVAVKTRTAGRNSDALAGSPIVERSESSTGEAKWVWLGAGLGLVMVWVIGYATRSTPDAIAHLFAVPIAIVTALLAWRLSDGLDRRDLEFIATAGLVGLAIHLSVSGGWTVPGVAIIGWLMAASLVPAEEADCSTISGRRLAGVGIIVVGMALAFCIYQFSVRPVEARRRAMAEAEYAQSAGQIGRTRVSLERAVEADPWSPEPRIWLSDFYRWQLIFGGDSPSVRGSWRAAVESAKSAAGEDPAVYRRLGEQQLHLFQRFGDAADLQSAASTIAAARRWSPSHEWLAAQLAAITAAQGRDEEAMRWAARAVHLSGLGNNIERSLDRQQIYEVRGVGRLAEAGPIRRPASEVLANQMATDTVKPD